MVRIFNNLLARRCPRPIERFKFQTNAFRMGWQLYRCEWGKRPLEL